MNITGFLMSYDSKLNISKSIHHFFFYLLHFIGVKSDLFIKKIFSSLYCTTADALLLCRNRKPFAFLGRIQTVGRPSSAVEGETQRET